MANFVITPNMNLTVPVPGVDPGPDYATNIYNSFVITDGHNHSNGYGAQINPSGININADLPMNGNNLTLVNTVRLVNLSSSLAGSAPNLGCLYEAANNLYFNDGAGNVVQITAAGAVNATSSGISSGTASASFSGGALVVDSNTNTPANVQCASVLIGNIVANSNFCTLSVANSLGSNYSVTLPPTNGTGGTVFMTYDSSNNMGIGVSTTAGIGTSNIANSAITTAKIAAGAVTASKITPNNIISSSSGNFSTSSGSAVQITALATSITTSGNPVWINFQSDGTSNNSFVGSLAGNPGFYSIHRNGSAIANVQTSFITGPGALNFVDYGASAGVNAYTVFCSVNSSDTLYAQYLNIVLREM